jgi:thiamine-phosphate pyrophosphorylase
MRSISNLHYITTSAAQAEQACMGGIDWIQLRLKNVSYDEYFKAGKEVQAVCKKYNATFIINDDIKLALNLDADGVHVGKEDPLPQNCIEEMLGKGGIIGCTANAIEDFEHLDGKPVSYIGLGPYRFTETKKKLSPILGLDGYRKVFAQLRARHITPPPVIGIGGITIDDVSVLMTTGLHGIAVSGAISGAPDIRKAAVEFKDILDPSNKMIHKTVEINATVSKVWKTITDPALIREWLFDTPVDVIADWKAGSSMIFKGTLYNKPYEDKGNILEYEPEKVFSYNYWSKLSSLPDEPGNYSVIEFRLSPLGDRTELSLTQSNFKLDTMYRHFNFYWALTIVRLKNLIEKV